MSACASTSIFSKFSAGELKNSLPLFDKDIIEETHSVSIPAFYNDNNNWRELTHETLLFAKVNIAPSEKVDQAIGAGKKKLSLLSPEERTDYLGLIGKSLHTDAVLNGMVLTRDGRSELVLQLLSLKDSRVIWWQAVEFTLTQGTVVQTEQKALLSKMLSPVLQYIGKKEKPALIPVQQQPKIGEQPAMPGTEPQPKTDIKPKPGKKQEKDIKSPAPEDNFSPM